MTTISGSEMPSTSRTSVSPRPRSLCSLRPTSATPSSADAPVTASSTKITSEIVGCASESQSSANTPNEKTSTISPLNRVACLNRLKPRNVSATSVIIV